MCPLFWVDPSVREEHSRFDLLLLMVVAGGRSRGAGGIISAYLAFLLIFIIHCLAGWSSVAHAGGGRGRGGRGGGGRGVSCTLIMAISRCTICNYTGAGRDRGTD